VDLLQDLIWLARPIGAWLTSGGSDSRLVRDPGIAALTKRFVENDEYEWP
jgi:hypothetical protein